MLCIVMLQLMLCIVMLQLQLQLLLVCLMLICCCVAVVGTVGAFGRCCIADADAVTAVAHVVYVLLHKTER